MELTRGFKGDRWNLDKLCRWRSKHWRQWVVANFPDESTALCRRVFLSIDNYEAYPSLVVAAHMRYPGCGMATKPADCFVYGMLDSEHKKAHNSGQDTIENQWMRVTNTMLSGLNRGVLVADEQAANWIRSCHLLAHSGKSDLLSTYYLDFVASHWARLFMSGQLKFNECILEG